MRFPVNPFPAKCKPLAARRPTNFGTITPSTSSMLLSSSTRPMRASARASPSGLASWGTIFLARFPFLAKPSSNMMAFLRELSSRSSTPRKIPPEKKKEAALPIPVSARAPIEAGHAPMKPSSMAEPRSLQQWLPDLVFGFENLASHKLRSLLTMLGMIFGVAAVVAMLSIGAGAQQKVMAFIEQLGVRNLIVEAKEAHNWQ